MIWKGSGKKISKFFAPEISTAPRETNFKQSPLSRRVFPFRPKFSFRKCDPAISCANTRRGSSAILIENRPEVNWDPVSSLEKGKG